MTTWACTKGGHCTESRTRGGACEKCGYPTPNTPEPAPKPGTATPTWELVLADMKERHAFGIEKYKQAHQADNGRDHRVDAYQEALDLAMYLRAEIERRKLQAARLEACFAFMRKDGHGLTLTQEQEILEALK